MSICAMPSNDMCHATMRVFTEGCQTEQEDQLRVLSKAHHKVCRHAGQVWWLRAAGLGSIHKQQPAGLLACQLLRVCLRASKDRQGLVS